MLFIVFNSLFGVRFVIRSLLFVVCCLFIVAWCLLFLVCSMVIVICCLLFVDCGLLFVVRFFVVVRFCSFCVVRLLL